MERTITIRKTEESKINGFLRNTGLAMATAALALTMTGCWGGSSGTKEKKSAPPVSNIKVTDFNVFYHYSGPDKIGDLNCNQPTSRQIERQSFEAHDKFVWKKEMGTSNCPLTILDITVENPELKITSIAPALPVTIPPHSTIEFAVKEELADPDKTSEGPVSMKIVSK
jgi:hypothetical protein